MAATPASKLVEVHRLAEAYRAQGYKVIIAPSPDELPAFLRSHRIDLLASGQDEKVALVVAGASSLRASARFSRIAGAVAERKSWRFELVAFPDEPEYPPKALVRGKSLPRSEIERALSDASGLLHSRHFVAALLVACAGLEAILRDMLRREKLAVSDPAPETLVKTLYSFGLLAKSHYALLIDAFAYRNAIAHGFRAKALSTRQLRVILTLARQWHSSAFPLAAAG